MGQYKKYDTVLKLRVTEDFMRTVKVLQEDAGYKTVSDVIRELVEKAANKLNNKEDKDEV